jgi:hypothetical protein
MIRVRGTFSVYFEDFSLETNGCQTDQWIWVAFGGDVPAPVVSTVNDNVREPGLDVKVNGVPYGIKKDENLRRLYALIAARHGNKPLSRATATLTGAFYAGEEHKLPSGHITYTGYGHLGCCSLLVITAVSEVESQPPANLNVRGTVIGPEGKPIPGFVVLNDVIGGMTPPQRQESTTDEKGQFEFSDSGQIFRFENPRYRPVAFAIDPGGLPIKVKLENAGPSDWTVPICRQTAKSEKRVGFSVLFAVPETMESNPMDDDDSKSFFVSPRGEGAASSELIISKWADKVSEPDDFSESNKPVQRWIKDGSGAVIGIDSRYRFSMNNRLQRSATFFNYETAAYSVPGSGQPRELDQIIDSACVLSR